MAQKEGQVYIAESRIVYGIEYVYVRYTSETSTSVTNWHLRSQTFQKMYY